jgi:Helicase associated domain
VEYQRQHGDCLVPNEYAGNLALGDFVNNLRANCDALSRDLREQLDVVGFAWDALEANWNAKFHELQRFQRQHGHCLVGPKHDAEYPGLGDWVNTQRRFRHMLDTKRIQQLDSIGFVWDARDATRIANWTNMFEQLRQYQTIHDNCKVPRSYRDPKLATWVITQRSTSTRTKLSPDQRAKLQSIGIFQ